MPRIPLIHFRYGVRAGGGGGGGGGTPKQLATSTRVPLIRFRYGVRDETPQRAPQTITQPSSKPAATIQQKQQPSTSWTTPPSPFAFNLPPLGPDEALAVILGLNDTPLPTKVIQSYMSRPIEVKRSPYDRLPPMTQEEMDLIDSGGATVFDPPDLSKHDVRRKRA